MTIQPHSIADYLAPSPTAKRAPPLVPPNSDEAGLSAIAAHFDDDEFELSVHEGAEEEEGLSEREKMFLSRETLIRFLTATKGDAQAAIERLEATIVWRRTERIEDVEAMAADCGPESETGKNFILGFTSESRPIIYFFPTRNTTPPERRRAVHAVFMLERATDLMVDGVTQSMVVFSFAGKRQGQPTSISVARQTLHILSEYYPEKLHLSHFQHVPWIVKTFINLMWPFVDPNTKRKVRFEEDICKDGTVGRDGLLQEVGGELQLAYKHEDYWPTLMRTCLERREDQLVRWRALGEQVVGREEKLFKVAPGTPPSARLEDDVD